MARMTRQGARRRFLAALVALLPLPRRALAQPVVNPAPGIDTRTINTPQGALQAILKGAAMRKGRVRLELPRVAEDGHSAPLIVRVNGTQRVTAIAQLSDGSFWFDAADVVVDESACLDGG